MDRDKVIKGMEQFRSDLKPFCGGKADWERFDAGLALLKEYEPMEPIECNIPGVFQCGSCGASVMREIGYRFMHCPWCGQAVKWDA